MHNLHRASAIAVATLLIGGCGQADDTSKAASSVARVEAIASTLQACSYDGKPVRAAASELSGGAPRDCADAVTRIMGYTGLPANFVVVSGPVPNAAAVILLDDKKVPRRVIAFNPEFMKAAEAQVGGSVWGPISIMAHEIAHHLSGHTIVPGGSRPEIELEADKFSGYILQKMGAPLAEAQRMIMTIGSSHGSATHPAKEQRADAIQQGWIESCTQAGGLDCRSGKAPTRSTGATPGASGSTVTAGQPALPSSVAMRPTANASVPARTLPPPDRSPSSMDVSSSMRPGGSTRHVSRRWSSGCTVSPRTAASR